MAVTSDQLAALEAAYFSGERAVSVGGRRVEYQDMAAMWQAILNARADLAAQAATATGAAPAAMRPMRFSTHRGF